MLLGVILHFLLAMPSDTLSSRPDPDSLPAAFLSPVKEVVYERADLKAIIKSLGRATNTNIYVDPQIDIQTSVRFYNLPLYSILTFFADTYDLNLEVKHGIMEIKPVVHPPQLYPEYQPPFIQINEGKLTLKARNVPTEVFLNQLTDSTGINFILESAIPSMVSGNVVNLEVGQAFSVFFANNQIETSVRQGIYHLTWINALSTDNSSFSNKIRPIRVEVKDSLISLEGQDIPIGQLVKQVTTQLRVPVFFYHPIEGELTAKAEKMTVSEFFSLVFRHTDYTYKLENNIYLIGKKNQKVMQTNKLVLLNNRKVENLLDIIPETLSENATITIIKEQNAILVTATQDLISEIESFIKTIDYLTPQVMIEALVVDFTESDAINTGLSAGRRGDSTSTRRKGDAWLPGIDVTFSADNLNQVTQHLPDVNIWGSTVSLAKIGKLPDDFYLRIQALESAGLAKVRSRPMLATLNGHKATLQVGTTQYYILKSTTPIRDNQGAIITETEQFKEISANITLEITPWVSTSGEVTVEIKPVFESPVGQFSPDIPPTINKRSFESTVRLSDGDTIVLGGLVEESESEVTEGIPYLSRIPYLNTLFSNKTTIKRKSELVIYLTPRVYIGQVGSD